MKDKEGIVYVLSNPAMTGIVKIGFTKKNEVEARLKELFTSSVPVPFECEFACRVDDCVAVESALHIAFSPNRIHPKREFFKIEPEQAIAILKLLQKDAVEVTKEINKKINSTTLAEDKEAGKELKKQRRPPLNFFEMGIKVGEKIELNSEDKKVIAEVVSAKKVKYKNQTYSLTALTTELFNLDYNIQPTRFWSYKGQNLQKMYFDTYQDA